MSEVRDGVETIARVTKAMDFDLGDPLNSLASAMDAGSAPEFNAFREDVNAEILEHKAVDAVLFALQEAGVSVGSQLADQIVPGELDPSKHIQIDDITLNSESAFGPFYYTMTVPNQVVNVCTASGKDYGDASAAMCDVSIALTVEIVFEDTRPSGAAPAGGPTTVSLSDFRLNILSGAVSNDYLSLTFSPAPEGDHVSGRLTAGLVSDSVSGAFESATLNIPSSLSVNIPAKLVEHHSGKEITVEAGLTLNTGQTSITYEAGENDDAPDTVNLGVLRGDALAGAALNITDNASRSISVDMSATATKSNASSIYSVLFGGELEGIDFTGEDGDDFLGLVVDAAVNTTMPATAISFTQTRLSADVDAITDLTATSGGETVEIAEVIYNEDGSVNTLTAENTTLGVKLTVSTSGATRTGTVSQNGTTVGTVTETGGVLSVEYTDDVTETLGL